MLETPCDWEGYGQVVFNGWSGGRVGVKMFFFVDAEGRVCAGPKGCGECNHHNVEGE